MGQPFKLYRLQLIDTELDRVKSRLQEIDIALSYDEPLRQANLRVEKASKAYQDANKLLRNIEQQVETQQIKIKETETALYGGKVSNPKELQDLSNESEALKRYLNTLEDRQIDAMLVAEDAEHQHREAIEKLEKVKAEVIQNNASLLGERSRLKKELERQLIERQAIASSISSEDLDLYENLRKQKNGVAVAKVSDQACAACGTTLNAAMVQAARSPNQIIRCSTCGRILYSQ
ncbi:MAG: hypothetical protein IBX69_09545 [Anaerolineales bacterium]|nr:hypothetical protein [Anaerolineales bacterium]